MWQDGTPITAQDFVDSLERVLRPDLENYRASEYSRGSYAVANAERYALSGNPVFQSFAEQGTTYEAFIASGGTDEQVAVDMRGFWNVIGPDSSHSWGRITDDTGVPTEDGNSVSAKYIWDHYLGPNGSYAGTADALTYAGTISYPYEAGYSFDNVGLFANGDNELTFVYANQLEGFYLMTYGMSINWLVKNDLYDSCLQRTESTVDPPTQTSAYGTSLETSVSYGPYMLTEYEPGERMHFSKNENWYGWNDENHVYIDPKDGNAYRMYQTTDVDIRYIKEAQTRKEMFLAGEQMIYGLQNVDYEQYSKSKYFDSTPAETVFFLLFNGYEKVIGEREAAPDFDQTTDLQVQMLESFRRACAISIDREKMAKAISPARSGGYGFLGNTYIYNPDTCAYYRDTDQAKQALVDFYSIDLNDYNGDLDAAANAITGYDPETAKEKFTEAYQEALKLGYITDSDSDSRSDQTVTMVYAMSSEVTGMLENTFNFLNTSLNNAAKGTGFERKIAIVPSEPVSNAWSDYIRDGSMDTELAGWSGGALDPFKMADTWTDPNASYWGKWYDANDYDMTLSIDGKDITMSVRDWALCLNAVETADREGGKHNFGYGHTSVENRLTILAAIERHMLTSFNCVPLLQDGSGSVLSQQVYYVVNEYNPMMSRGGIQYLKYHYDDEAWEAYIKKQGGILQY